MAEGASGSRKEELFARVVLALGLVEPATMEAARRELPVPAGSSTAAGALRELLVKRGAIDPELASAIERLVEMAVEARRQERPAPASGLFEKPVPTGEGFALRSRKEVAEAWAARKRMEPSPAPRAPVEGEHPEKKKTLAAERTPQGAQPDGLDVQALKAELGIGSGPVQAREETLRAFLRRVAPGVVQANCLIAAAKNKSAVATARRLAQEAGCPEEKAAQILERWRRLGLVRPDPLGLPEFQFSPSEPDAAKIKEFLVLWRDPAWHPRILQWLLEEEKS